MPGIHNPYWPSPWKGAFGGSLLGSKLTLWCWWGCLSERRFFQVGMSVLSREVWLSVFPSPESALCVNPRDPPFPGLRFLGSPHSQPCGRSPPHPRVGCCHFHCVSWVSSLSTVSGTQVAHSALGKSPAVDCETNIVNTLHEDVLSF